MVCDNDYCVTEDEVQVNKLLLVLQSVELYKLTICSVEKGVEYLLGGVFNNDNWIIKDCRTLVNMISY